MISIESLINTDNIPKYEIKKEDEFKIISNLYKHINEIESSEGIIKSIVAFAIKIITKIINFITKCLTWISRVIVHALASWIAFLTKSHKPAKKNSESFIQKLKNFAFSKEDINENLSSFVSYIKSFIKSPQDVNKMTKEELIFYKTFLVNGNINNIRMVCDSFNRQTSKLKEYGLNIEKKGNILLLQNRGLSKENYLFSIEDENKYLNMNDQMKDVKIDNNTDIKKEYMSTIDNIYRSLYANPNDSVWLTKIKNIFTNGSKELKTITDNLKKKQQYLENLNQENINNDMKTKISEYTKEIKNFQPSIYSYINCINYFNKYNTIRMNISRKFCILVDKVA